MCILFSVKKPQIFIEKRRWNTSPIVYVVSDIRTMKADWKLKDSKIVCFACHKIVERYRRVMNTSKPYCWWVRRRKSYTRTNQRWSILHIFLERSTISFYQLSSTGPKKNRIGNNQNRSIKWPAMHVMNSVFKIKRAYPEDILPKYKCVCVCLNEKI